MDGWMLLVMPKKKEENHQNDRAQNIISYMNKLTN